MNLILDKAPKLKEVSAELDSWFERLWNRVTKHVSESGDANAEIPTASNVHSVTSLSAPRQLTLGKSKNYRIGDGLWVQDRSGSAGTHTISIAAAAGENIYGLNSISTNYGRRYLILLDAGKWYAA